MSDKHTLYISFASEDNLKGKEANGWIDDFVRYLSVYVQKINNQTPEIIKLEDTVKRPTSLGPSDGIILIVSEKYLSKNLSKSDAPLLTDSNRVYKIDLHPIKKSDQPQEIRTFNEFHFFDSNPERTGFERLGPSQENPKFWLKVIDLAFEIDRSIYQKKRNTPEERKKIYLAETSYDQVHNKDEIKRELIRHGHTILPHSPFSGNASEIEKQVQECLNEADLSVHIIGEDYGEIPEGSQKSIVEIQNELSQNFYANASSANQNALHRLIWMPVNLKARSDQQKLYLDQLKDDIASTAGAEIIQTPLEILKTVIHTRLQLFDFEQRMKSEREMQRSERKTVYLLFDQKDAKDIEGIIGDIESRNMEVLTPQFGNKKVEFLRSHRRNLINSDAVLLYANGNLNWVNSKLNDVIKAPGFGKQFSFDAQGIYIKNGSIPKDKIADFGDLVMLNGDNKSKKIDISSFLDKIAST